MAAPARDKSSWSEYYQKTSARPPRDLFLQAVEHFSTPGTAIDLGCGGGCETRELLRRGWQVVAVDQELSAIEYLTAHVPPEDRERLVTHCVGFAEITLPAADFIWAGLSLPFCHPDHFPLLWANITASLRDNGRFAGDLFGVHHVWKDNPGMTFLTRTGIDAYLETFTVELLAEREEERQTVFQGMQHWHGFNIIVCKRENITESVVK